MSAKDTVEGIQSHGRTTKFNPAKLRTSDGNRRNRDKTAEKERADAEDSFGTIEQSGGKDTHETPTTATPKGERGPTERRNVEMSSTHSEYNA